MKRLSKLLCVVALSYLGAATPAVALPLTLTLIASDATLVAGQAFSVAVVVGGLTELDGDFVQEIALESFSLSLQFEPSRLHFESLDFGLELGGPGDSFTNGPGDANGTGVVTLGEFSFLTESQLLELQDAPFTLATIGLRANEGLGDTPLAFRNLGESSLGGVNGRKLGGLLETPSALDVTVVPEPALAAPLLLSLALVTRRACAPRA